ncbi:MAG TPA: hypothetical protein VN259_03725 [Xanthomonadales bacterium]|nr:hypothetical protein [Xanthomonadales bacterium]
MSDLIQVLVDFLNGIGIGAYEGAVPVDSFLPGLRIVDGCLIYDRAALRWPGDLLHEAGHIATVPAAMRAGLNDALADAPESPHGGEAEATAWAFAALTHLRLPLSVLFHEGGYHGKSAGLILTYSAGVYPGCHGLLQAGMALGAADAARAGVQPYPHLIRWLRP